MATCSVGATAPKWLGVRFGTSLMAPCVMVAMILLPVGSAVSSRWAPLTVISSMCRVRNDFASLDW